MTIDQLNILNTAPVHHRHSKLGRGLVLCALVASLILAGGIRVRAEGDSLKSSFRAPAKTFRPSLRWWWPGGDVNAPTLVQQLGEFDAAGFGGVEIQPFRMGLPMGTKDPSAIRINDYATPAFFGHLTTVAKEADRLGMTVDYTLGSAWPTGGGDAVTPALASRELSVSHQTVRGPGPFQGPITPPPLHRRLGKMLDMMAKGISPDFPSQLKAQEKIVAIVAMRGSGPETKPRKAAFGPPDPEGEVIKSGQVDPASAIVLTDRLRADGTLEWQIPEGEWQLMVFKQYVVDQRIPIGVGHGPQLVIDHWNKEALAAHAKHVFGDGVELFSPYLGRSLRALFVDSIELEVDTYWTDSFLAEFKKRRGYDLTPHLPSIVVPRWEISYHSAANPPLYETGEEGKRVRADYRRTLSELMIENFFQPLEEYAKSHGLISRVQAHGAPVELIQGYGTASIPETESMDAPTTPGFELVYARSAGHVYGRKIVSAESLCWPGNPYAPTVEMWKRRVDLFFVAGVNQLVFHGAPYPYLNDVPPGWHPFMPPSQFSTFFSTAHPYWAHLRAFTGYVTRLQALLQQTDPAVGLAIFRDEIGTGAGGEGLSKAPQAVERTLAAEGYCADLLNGDGLLKSRVDKGLLLTPGGVAYAALVLPDVKTLRLEVAEKIVEVARAGLPVLLLDQKPSQAEGFYQFRLRDEKVKTAVAATLRHGARQLPSDDLLAALRELGLRPNVAFQGSAVPFIEKRAGNRRLVFCYNPDDVPRRVVFDMLLHGGAERWDPWSGAVAPIGTEEIDGGRRINLLLEPGESALVVIDPSIKPDALKSHAASEKTSVRLGDKGWEFHANGYGKDGRAIDVSRHLADFIDWASDEVISDLAGNGVYTAKFAVGEAELAPGRRLTLNLGEVRDLAEVKINSRIVGTLYMKPFAVDITGAVRVGENTVEITVANTPNNAMVGRVLKGMMPGNTKNPFQPMAAGLLGPVTLVVKEGGM